MSPLAGGPTEPHASEPKLSPKKMVISEEKKGNAGDVATESEV
jgi:hypothetical protein